MVWVVDLDQEGKRASIMFQSAGIALRTYFLPITSTRSFKIGFLCFLGFLGLVGVAVLVRPLSRFLGDASLDRLGTWAVLPGVPLAALLLSEIPLRDGIRHRTLLYPLLGPVARRTLALVRTTSTAVMTALALTGLLLIVRLFQPGEVGLAQELLAVWLGSAAYVGVFGLVHLVGRRSLISGLAFYGLLDDPLGRLPFGLRNLAPSFHMRVLAGQEVEIELPVVITPPESSVLVSTFVLLAVAVVMGAATAFFFTRKQLGTLC